MTNGVMLFAFNNSDIDYVKQAIYCAKRIKTYIGLPVQLITDSVDYIQDTYPFYKKKIDKVKFSPTAKITYKKF